MAASLEGVVPLWSQMYVENRWDCGSEVGKREREMSLFFFWKWKYNKYLDNWDVYYSFKDFFPFENEISISLVWVLLNNDFILF